MLTEAWLRANIPTTFVEPPHSYRSALTALRDRLKMRPAAHLLRPWPLRYPLRWLKKMPERRIRAIVRAAAYSLRQRLGKRFDWHRATAIVVSPAWTPWLSALPFGKIIYDCIDDLTVHAPDPATLRLFQNWENELLTRCTGAVVTAETLRETIHTRRKDLPIEMIRNGADVDGFRRRAAASNRPTDLPSNNRPLIGFVGALYQWIDWALIETTARQLPQFDFVLIGPCDDPSKLITLRQQQNVHILGPRPYEQVAAYVNAFDVCWVPFAPGIITTAANPVKIYEYLSLGKPVVSTPVADVKSFEGLVRVGETADEIVSHLLTACESAPPIDADARLAFARRNSWDERAAAYVRFIERL